MKHVVEARRSTASPSFPSTNPPSDHDGSQPSTSRKPSRPESRTASSGISGTGSEISDGEVHLAGSSKQCRKERKQTTKRKLPTEDTGEEEALFIKKSLESIEKQGESSLQLWRVCSRTILHFHMSHNPLVLGGARGTADRVNRYRRVSR